MMIKMFKSKIHRATVTDANLNYEGSITLDQNLLDAADLLPNEMVQVLNISNGARVETYVIPGDPGSGIVCLNGAAARWFHPGDLVIIISGVYLDPKEAKQFLPKVIKVDKDNRPLN